MKIRSITCFIHPRWPLDENTLQEAGEFVQVARSAFTAAGYEVQTTRLATVPFPELMPSATASKVVEFALMLASAAAAHGYDYLSIGPAYPEKLESYPVIPDVLAATQNVFTAGSLTTVSGEVSLPAIRACAEVIRRSALLSTDGFANLRFAALANVPPGAPFFPAAYHSGDHPAFALATEAADLAVDAFTQADTLNEARQNLIQAIEQHAQVLAGVGRQLDEAYPPSFKGIDFSLAPFPVERLSIGSAIERLGVPAVGLSGSLSAAAILADTLDRANFPRAGFSGLFLPVLEDAVLARRAAQGLLTITDLLLYSAVCGTGLDTIPLPGDTSSEALAAILLDLACLATRLEKPLTARLMPIPGKKAGDPTDFDFAYFANSRVLATGTASLSRNLAGSEVFPLQRRNR